MADTLIQPAWHGSGELRADVLRQLRRLETERRLDAIVVNGVAHQLFVDADPPGFDLGRLAGAIGWPSDLLAACLQVFYGHPFDPVGIQEHIQEVRSFLVVPQPGYRLDAVMPAFIAWRLTDQEWAVSTLAVAVRRMAVHKRLIAPMALIGAETGEGLTAGWEWDDPSIRSSRLLAGMELTGADTDGCKLTGGRFLPALDDARFRADRDNMSYLESAKSCRIPASRVGFLVMDASSAVTTAGWGLYPVCNDCASDCLPLQRRSPASACSHRPLLLTQHARPWAERSPAGRLPASQGRNPRRPAPQPPRPRRVRTPRSG